VLCSPDLFRALLLDYTKLGGRARVAVGDDKTVTADGDCAVRLRTWRPAEGEQELPIKVERLDPVRTVFADVDPPIGGAGTPCCASKLSSVELALAVIRLTPRSQELAAGRELVDDDAWFPC
jgi:hypothetical protein